MKKFDPKLCVDIFLETIHCKKCKELYKKNKKKTFCEYCKNQFRLAGVDIE